MLTSHQAPFRVALLSVALLVVGLTTGVALSDDSTDRVDSASAPGTTGASGTPSGPAALTPATSCQDLLDHLVAESIDQVGPWGWERFLTLYRDGRLAMAAPMAEVATYGATDSSTAQSSSATGTNVQEVGIDEPDVAKTDGSLLVRIDRRMLTTYDVTGDTVRKLGSLRLSGRVAEPELLLSGDRVLVLSATWDERGVTSTRVTSIDVGDPNAPEVVDARNYDGELLSARLTGTVARLVTATDLPAFDFVEPNRNRTRRQARRENRRIVEESSIDDWLPSVREGERSAPYLDCADVRMPADNDGVGVVSVIGFPVTEPTQIDSTAVVTSSQIVYTATDRLYLATGGWNWGWGWDPIIADGPRRGRPDDGTTDLHSFALDATSATYSASGRIDGRIADRWSMDSVDGVLRVAVATSEQKGKNRWKNANAVATVAEEDGALVELDRVGDLGVDENIQSVRWFDDLAIVVTFRQVDPLYAIDVSNAADLTLLGELKIPGFSAYLHPIGDDRLIGLGEDATLRGRSLGAQASTFDISDPTRPAQLDKVTYGRRATLRVAWEPRQFTWLPESRTALTVLTRYVKGPRLAISVLAVDERGSLSDTTVPVAGGWRAESSLRTLPLPDGRVVATSSAGTDFLTW